MTTSKPSIFSEQALDLFKWLAAMAVPLGGILLAISALYWFEFTKAYDLPVSFTSPGVLAGLPALAAAVAATVAVLSLAALVPAIFLSMPIDGNGCTLLHGHQRWRREKNAASQRRGRWCLGSLSLQDRWGIISLVIAAAWPAIIFGMTYLKNDGAAPVIWGLVAGVLIFAYGLMWGIYKLARTDQSSPLRYVMEMTWAVASQLLVVFWVYYGALHMAPNSEVKTLIELSIACVALSIVVALAQLLTAHKMVHGWSSQDAKVTVLVAVFVIALPLIYPPFGAIIAAYPLQISAGDGSKCVVLYPSDTASKKTWSDIADAAHPDESQHLWFVSPLNDIYYAKLSPQSPTQIIPAAQVRKVGSCSMPVAVAAPVNGSDPKASPTLSNDSSGVSISTFLISAGTALVALLSLIFSVRLWRQSNRPLLTARISTHDGGNMGITLNILVENTGTSPAMDIQLRADEADIRAAMADPSVEQALPADASRVFFSELVIPVLANGRVISNAFGSLGNEGVWRAGASIPFEMVYYGMTGPKFKERLTLLLSDDAGFAQTFWSTPEKL